MNEYQIKQIKARHVFDSRGNPTIFCRVILQGGAQGTASVPSGASTGKYEAVEKRDGERAYGGKGVFSAIYGINGKIAEHLTGMDARDQRQIDHTLLALDGSENKEVLGANATLALSLACAKAAANALHIPLYRYLGGVNSCRLPLPFLNLLNGGRHAENGLDVQEYMIVPLSATSFAGAMRIASEVYHALGDVLKKDGQHTALGDEGGYAPLLQCDEQALDYLMHAISKAGYQPGKDVAVALDAAASEWQKDGRYLLQRSGRELDASALADHYRNLLEGYPIISIEDPFGEEDFDAFSSFTAEMGKKIQIVGDDLFVTNEKRVHEGIRRGCCNCVLIKPNQVGTLSETLDTVALARAHGYRVMLSHRSGETEDPFLADLAVALGSGQIKAGAPARGERTAKYNRLLEIEDELEPHALYGLL